MASHIWDRRPRRFLLARAGGLWVGSVEVRAFEAAFVMRGYRAQEVGKGGRAIEERRHWPGSPGEIGQIQE